jgi:hypothetical protein
MIYGLTVEENNFLGLKLNKQIIRLKYITPY